MSLVYFLMFFGALQMSAGWGSFGRLSGLVEKFKEGEGDCDFNTDCQDGLKCGDHNCYLYRNTRRSEDDDDCCYDPSNIPAEVSCVKNSNGDTVSCNCPDGYEMYQKVDPKT